MDSSSLSAAAIAHLNSTNTETSTFLLDEMNAERPFFDGLHPMKKTIDSIKQLVGQIHSSNQQPTITATYNYQPQPTTTFNNQPLQPQLQPTISTTTAAAATTATYNYQHQPTTTFNNQPLQPQPTIYNNPNRNNYYTDSTAFQSKPTWDTTGMRQRDTGLNSRLNRELNFGENRYFQNFRK